LIHLRLLYFAGVRERAKRNEEALQLSAGATLATLLKHLLTTYPQLAPLKDHLRIAVNQEFAPLDCVLRDGDEVALIPPVSGGSGLFRVTSEPLSLDEVVRAVSVEEHGGIATFTGVVRRISRGKRILRLEYEAYAPMAEREMAAIGAQLAAEMPGVRVAIVHRVGSLSVGEAAVVIATSAPHRAQAFDACRAAIDRLKQSVPIWKKEISEDGEEWIGDRP
jgi:molybdopterin synthase catalytic subunit